MADLTKLFAPGSLAIIGASGDPGIIRGRFVQTFLHHRFSGRVYLVSRSEETVMGHATHPHISALPEPVDLAVILAPASAVPEVLADCGEAGVGAAVVVASGFAEADAGVAGAGQAAQARIAALARRYDMALLGPNSEGFMVSESGLAATFSPVVESLDPPLPQALESGRRIAVVAQSGAIGFGLADALWARQLAVSAVVTTGNEAALDLLTVVEHLLTSDAWDVLLLFLEGLQRPQALGPLAAKALAQGKPIIVIKVGRSEPARRAALSHTGALTGSQEGFRAVARRGGLIEAGDLDEAADLAAAFACHRGRLPHGRRVGITSATGGGGGWLADACSAAGLTVPDLDRATRQRLEALLPSYGSSQNPVDTTATAVRSQGYARFAAILAQSPAVDMVLVTASGRTTKTVERERDALKALGAEADKPVLVWSYSQPTPAFRKIMADCGLPVATSLRNLARMATALADYGAVTRRPAPAAVRGSEARRGEVAARLAGGGPLLHEHQAMTLLAEAGLVPMPSDLVGTAEEALARFDAIDGPVALKLQSPDIAHKADAGAVALDLRDGPAVAAAFEAVMREVAEHRPDARIDGVSVQPMAPPGLELIVGTVRDPQFGPLVMVGAGGRRVEVLEDRVFLAVPLDAAILGDELARLKLYPLLESADLKALAGLVVGLSELALDHADQILEIDLNPVILHDRGAGLSVVDALIVTAETLCTGLAEGAPGHGDGPAATQPVGLGLALLGEGHEFGLAAFAGPSTGARLALLVAAVRLHFPSVSRVFHLEFENLIEIRAQTKVLDRRDRLDPAFQIAGHQIGRANVVLVIAAVFEVVDAGMLQKARDHADHPHIVRDPGQARAQAAGVAHDQIHRDPGLAGLVERVDDIGVFEGVGLQADVAGGVVAVELDFTLDLAQQGLLEDLRRSQQLAVLARRPAAAGQVVEQLRQVAADVVVGRSAAPGRHRSAPSRRDSCRCRCGHSGCRPL